MPWAKAFFACVCHHVTLPLTVPGVTIHSFLGGGIRTQPHQQGKVCQQAIISTIICHFQNVLAWRQHHRMTGQIKLIARLIITLHVHLHVGESDPHLTPRAQGIEGY